jgi:hypothetical protein
MVQKATEQEPEQSVFGYQMRWLIRRFSYGYHKKTFKIYYLCCGLKGDTNIDYLKGNGSKSGRGQMKMAI